MRSLMSTACLAMVLLVGCDELELGSEPVFKVRSIGMTLPRLEGWVADDSTGSLDAAKGGVLLRVVREGAAPCSPRIDVLLEPRKTHPSSIEGFLTQNQREMARFEEEGSLRISQVEQRPVSIGPRRGYRLRHEYTMLNAGAAPLAITQLSTLLVLDGRGVAVTAVGCTELFHPLSDSIERILGGLAVPVPPGAPPATVPVEPVRVSPGGSTPPPTPSQPVTPVVNEPPSSVVEPIDLGKLGGG